MTEELYHKLKSGGMKGLELGVQNAVLVSAFGSKTIRLRMQAMLPICIDDIVLDHIFLISPQLSTQALYGVDFCRLNNIVIDFPEQCLTMERYDKVSKHYLAHDDNVRPRSTGNPGPADRDTQTAIKFGQGTADLNTDKATTDYASHKLRKEVADEIDVIRRSGFEGIIKGRPFDKGADGDSDKGTIYNAEQTTRCKLNNCYSSDGINNDRESKGSEGTLNYDVCTASILGRNEERNVDNTEPASGTDNVSTEDRTITEDQICNVVNELESLTPDQAQKLPDILLKYQGSLTKKPGKCNSKWKVNCQSLLFHALYYLHCDRQLAGKYDSS